jgi:hypothetical protein
MVPFLFRSQRIEHDLNMQVGLQDILTGESLPDLLTTTVVNFSPQGACLILPNLIVNGQHLFYATLNKDRYNLLLYFDGRNEIEGEFTIAAEPIWMDTCEHLSKPAFKIGIRFLHNQKKLFDLFK